jgi:hypothetical protein
MLHKPTYGISVGEQTTCQLHHRPLWLAWETASILSLTHVGRRPQQTHCHLPETPSVPKWQGNCQNGIQDDKAWGCATRKRPSGQCEATVGDLYELIFLELTIQGRDANGQLAGRCLAVAVVMTECMGNGLTFDLRHRGIDG